VRRLLIFSLLVALGGAAVLAVPSERSVAAPVSARIAGGTPAAAGAYPWQTALISATAPNRPSVYQRYFFCGGTLIAPRRILTAAHCVAGLSAGDVDVLVGGLRLDNPAMRRIHVSNVSTDPGYNFAADSSGSDVAIMRLSRAVTAVTPLPLITRAQANLLHPGSQVRAVGWGQTAFHSRAPLNTLRQADLKLVADGRCNQVYGAGFHQHTQLCAGATPGKGACFGDSGGPLLVSDGAGGWRQLGVVNLAASCVTNRFPQVFARVATLRGFALSPSPLYSPENHLRPSIHGRLHPGGRLACHQGRWSGRGIHFLYLWVVRRRGSGRFVLLPGAIHRAIHLQASDAGSRFQCLVAALNPGGLGIAVSRPVQARR
jgi:secreted trypsin-like serine protease